MTGRGYRGGDIILFLDLGNGLHEYSLCDDSSHHVVMIFCASFYVYYYSNKLLIKRLQKPNKKILLPVD